MIKKIKKIIKKGLVNIGIINPFRSYFKEIEFETTAYCNRRCAYCPQSKTPRVGNEGGKYMPEGIFKKLIQDLKDIGFHGLISPHLYGEPMSDHRLLSWVKYIRQELPKSTIKIVTNGDYLAQDNYGEFIKAGVNFFYISKHGSKLSLGVEALLKSLSEDEKKKRIKVFDYYGDYQGRQEMLTSRGGDILLKKERKHPQYCLYVTYPVVDTFGNIILCCNDYHSRYVSGNIIKRSLGEIWRDPKNIKERAKIYKGIFNLPICQNCWM